MTRTISLIIGIAVVALVAVPTAFGSARPTSANRTPVVGEGRYVAPEHSSVPARLDVSPYRGLVERVDYGERALRITQLPSTTVLLSGDDHVTTPVTDEPAPTTSGRDIEWPQVGIGFGIAILLAIGLGLSLKATRPRTLAH